MTLLSAIDGLTVLFAAGDDPTAHVKDVVLIDAGGLPIVTLHMIQLIFATLLMLLLMVLAANAIATGPESRGHERYVTKGRISQVIEVIVIYLRDEVIYPVLGDQGRKFLPFLLSVFFFILSMNLLGLVPLLDLQHLIGGITMDNWHWAVLGSTPTGNLSITAALSIIAFFVINIHGIIQNGIGGWLHHLLGGAPAFMAPIMVPVELMSMFIKPGALAIRLFANMLAGHTLMAVLAGFGVMAIGAGTDPNFLVGGLVSVVSIVFSTLIFFLEVFVAFLQAFIFMFLTTIFISQMSHHDHDHDHPEHEEDPAHHFEYEAEVPAG